MCILKAKFISLNVTLIHIWLKRISCSRFRWDVYCNKSLSISIATETAIFGKFWFLATLMCDIFSNIFLSILWVFDSFYTGLASMKFVIIINAYFAYSVATKVVWKIWKENDLG